MIETFTLTELDAKLEEEIHSICDFTDKRYKAPDIKCQKRGVYIIYFNCFSHGKSFGFGCDKHTANTSMHKMITYCGLCGKEIRFLYSEPL